MSAVEIGLHSFGRTALHIAAADGRAEIAGLLLHAKASVHAKDNAGYVICLAAVALPRWAQNVQGLPTGVRARQRHATA